VTTAWLVMGLIVRRMWRTSFVWLECREWSNQRPRCDLSIWLPQCKNSFFSCANSSRCVDSGVL
jgi:hypothetical protein